MPQEVWNADELSTGGTVGGEVLSDLFEVVVVGAGPSGLSVAAALEVEGIECVVLDASESISWHPGSMYPWASMQTPWHKDLISGHDATNPFTFLNYLVSTGRAFDFFAAGFEHLPRREFDRYLGWAASRLSDIRLGVRVTEVRFADDHYVVETTKGEVVRASNVVFAVGTQPRDTFVGGRLPAHRAISVSELLSASGTTWRNDPPRSAAVIGGGQSGAEAVVHLEMLGVEHISWITSDDRYLVLEASPSADEIFGPREATEARGDRGCITGANGKASSGGETSPDA